MEDAIVKIVLNIAGVFMALIGIIWILQGVNILPGSFMTGDPKWAVIGVLCLGIAVGWLIHTNRRQAPSE